jgi:GTPase
MPDGQSALMMDTVGFISNLPHGLVESFKATLDELHMADLIVHVRDISNPQTDFQKQTVLRVMQEVGLPETFLKEKMIEVWNKVDLVTDQEAFRVKAEAALSEAQHPIVLMSATEGYNKDLFLAEVSLLTATLKGKHKYKLTYPSYEHGTRLQWLVRNANLTAEQKEIEIDD